MNGHLSRWLAVVAAVALLGVGSRASAQPTFKAPERYRPSAEERGAIEAKLAESAKAIDALPRGGARQRDAIPDVAVYHKAGDWALRLGEFYRKADVKATLGVLDRGIARAGLLAKGERPWVKPPGEQVRGYTSRVDGSIQPYIVVVPAGLDLDRRADRRARLDVVLHGRGATLNEVHFIAAHDGKPAPADLRDALVLHVFGRTNNAYRWAGEADVFEAIEAVKREFPVDERRVVLRGFSMGGAGAWHLGLHYPSRWSSVEAGAGFSETRNYAKLGAIPEVQEKALRIYDAVDYAGNAYNVPMAGYGGENDPQRQAAINIEEALKGLGYSFKTEGLLTRGEGIDFLRVVGKGMGHAVDPASAKVLGAFHDEHAAKGADLTPKRIRFATSTLKYSEAAWLAIEQLKEHYRPASVEAEIRDKRVVVLKAENVAVLSVERHVAESIRLGDQEFPLESAVKGLLPNVYFRLVAEGWQQLDYDASRGFQENAERGKRRDLQGPIDDAFSGPFLCVRGTGKPWNPLVQRWADDRLARFADVWRRWLRGEVRIKDDTEVTDADIEDHHLVLFGDPGSNRVLARVYKDLPLGWTRTDLDLSGTFRAADHAPALIAPNPLNVHRYVVVNSGHSFGDKEFAGTNALLFPRLGDYAVFHVDRDGGEVKVSGFFDEKWKLKTP